VGFYKRPKQEFGILKRSNKEKQVPQKQQRMAYNTAGQVFQGKYTPEYKYISFSHLNI